nr:hypothetical protein CFP56_50355 [Quercus suber]
MVHPIMAFTKAGRLTTPANGSQDTHLAKDNRLRPIIVIWIGTQTDCSTVPSRNVRRQPRTHLPPGPGHETFAPLTCSQAQAKTRDDASVQNPTARSLWGKN